MNPGTHLREVARRVEAPLGTALYHLDFLDDRGLLVARRDGRYKRYFPAHSFGSDDKALLTVLRHEVPRRIVVSLLGSSAATQRRLSVCLGVSRSTLSFHINRLLEEGIVGRERDGPEYVYHLADKARVRDVLQRFADSLVDAPPPGGQSPIGRAAPARVNIGADHDGNDDGNDDANHHAATSH